ncbi:MAG: OmpA family protein [Flavobacteriia bacterium]|jgi:outer membrane protein OmpA-like peptidoglycan-associated protein
MKKILLVSGLVLGASAFGQSVFNKMSVDFGYGVNKALSGPVMGAAVSKQFAHIDLGVRYMANNRWGLYGGLVHEGYNTTIADVDYKTTSIGIKLEGILSFRNTLDFNQFVKNFGAFGHAGPSMVLNSGKASDGVVTHKLDKLAGWTTGLTLQYKASSKLSVKGDVSFVAYLQGDRSLDLQKTQWIGLSNGFDGTTGFMTIGASYYLGSAPEHADWTPTNYGDAEAMAALKAKIEKAEKDMMDDDKDGVPNYLDQEPGTAAGATVDTKGKTVKVVKVVDMDGDGVLDVDDFCPTIKGVSSANGCPDADGDNVYDFVDKCKNAAGLAIDGGCPVISKETKERLKAAEGIQFDNGKATIVKKSLANLDNVAKIMLANPAYNLMINGHTDNVGDPAKNLKLSEDRTKAVKAYLMGKGVAENRMTATGYGDTQPKASNATAKGKAANRRVEFIIKFQE